MPRPHRICLEETTYHVYTRCIDRSSMLRKDLYKEILLDTLAITQNKYSFDLIFYQILDNHIHLVIKTRKGEATISRIVQYIKARFAEKYNKRNNRTGPFWNERFGDVMVEFQENPVFYFLWLLWYLAYNAVRMNKVRDPRTYRYGSINSYLNEENHDNGKLRITLHRYFNELGSSFADRMQKFLVYERMYRQRLWLPV